MTNTRPRIGGNKQPIRNQ